MVGDETNVSNVGAQVILRLKVEDRQGKIHVGATLVDVKTQKNTATEDVDASSIGALIPALDKLAKRIDPYRPANFPPKTLRRSSNYPPPAPKSIHKNATKF